MLRRRSTCQAFSMKQCNPPASKCNLFDMDSGRCQQTTSLGRLMQKETISLIRLVCKHIKLAAILSIRHSSSSSTPIKVQTPVVAVGNIFP